MILRYYGFPPPPTITMNPCHFDCRKPELKSKYHIVSQLEDLTEEQRHEASHCKFCETFLVIPVLPPEQNNTRYKFCPCCCTRTHKAMRQQGKKGKWFEVY